MATSVSLSSRGMGVLGGRCWSGIALSGAPRDQGSSRTRRSHFLRLVLTVLLIGPCGRSRRGWGLLGHQRSVIIRLRSRQSRELMISLRSARRVLCTEARVRHGNFLRVPIMAQCSAALLPAKAPLALFMGLQHT
jgi:hypothetical protein